MALFCPILEIDNQWSVSTFLEKKSINIPANIWENSLLWSIKKTHLEWIVALRGGQLINSKHTQLLSPSLWTSSWLLKPDIQPMRGVVCEFGWVCVHRWWLWINIPLSYFLKTCVFLLGITNTNNASWKKEESPVRLYPHRSKCIQTELLDSQRELHDEFG